MYKGEQLKYGWIRGGKVSVPVAMAASQDVIAPSGKFVYMNAGAATLIIDGSTRIFGFVETEAQTPATGEELNCIIDLTAVFRIPISTGHTYNINMVGDGCELEMDVNATGVQSAQLDAGVQQIVFVVAGDDDNDKWVDVMMNPALWGTGSAVA